MASPIATTSRNLIAVAPRISRNIALRSVSTTTTTTTTTAAAATSTSNDNTNTNNTATQDEAQERRRLHRTLISELQGMGSQQTRENSFRPFKLRLHPVEARRLTLEHLVASSAQLGHTLASLRQAHQPHLYGSRHGIAIFDLEKATIPALKRAANVVRSVAERDGIILFIGTRPAHQPAVLSAAKRMPHNAFHVTSQRWMPGVITNAPKLLASSILSSFSQSESTISNSNSDTSNPNTPQTPNTNRLASQTYQPDLVIVLNPRENAYAIREATQANIPTIAITDSDVDPRSVTYPIPANDDSIRTVELVIGVLSKAGQEGVRNRDRAIQQADKTQRKERRRLANSINHNPSPV